MSLKTRDFVHPSAKNWAFNYGKIGYREIQHGSDLSFF